jgi:hypothetical protein
VSTPRFDLVSSSPSKRDEVEVEAPTSSHDLVPSSSVDETELERLEALADEMREEGLL